MVGFLRVIVRCTGMSLVEEILANKNGRYSLGIQGITSLRALRSVMVRWSPKNEAYLRT